MARPLRVFSEDKAFTLSHAEEDITKLDSKVAKMLYEDLVKVGEKPQDALTKVIKG